MRTPSWQDSSRQSLTARWPLGPSLGTFLWNSLESSDLLCFDFQPNKSIDQSYKMPTSRCVRLMLISMANDLKEVWISDHPVLLGAYLWQYMPTWGLWLTSRLGKKRIQNFKNGLVRAIYIFLHNYVWILCENPMFNVLKDFLFFWSIPVLWWE